MLDEAQIVEIKKQIFQQIEAWPEEQRESARAKIEAMSPEEFEEFLIKNKMIKSGDESADGGEDEVEGGKCIFCSIVEKKIPSSFIAENPWAIAVLEINPVSKGHTLIIPKKHVLHGEDLGKEIVEFIKNVALTLREGLKPKHIERWGHVAFGHFIINLIPAYEDTHLDFPRKKGDVEELKKGAASLKEVFDKADMERQVKEKPVAQQTPSVVEKAPFRRP